MPTHTSAQQPAGTGQLPGTHRLLVADSFRVREHNGVVEARSLTGHIGRFSHAVSRATDGALAGVGDFLDEARERIADYGEGNPRWELWGVTSEESARSGSPTQEGFELRLSLRQLPELRATIELRTVGAIQLEHPERKGMNIERFASLNRSLGAEAVLTDDDGYVVEGTTTSLLWWEGDLLCSAVSERRVASVTERAVVNAAEAAGVASERRFATPVELALTEVWAVNALHGLRPVSAIDGVPAPAPDAQRLAAFQATLDETWQPVRVNLQR